MTVVVDLVLLGFVILEATREVSGWIFVLALFVAVVTLSVSARRAADVSESGPREEAPHAALRAFALLSGVVGVLALHAGRYAGFVVVGYLVLAAVVERVAWSRFHATRQAAG
jgi:uncharacterized membrane protein YhaH (DUF805 family)